MMSDKKRDLMKITIDDGDDTKVLECHGIAGVTLEDTGDCHKMAVVLVGNLSVADLIALHDNIEKELLPLLKKQIVDRYLSSNSKDKLGVLLGTLLGDN